METSVIPDAMSSIAYSTQSLGLSNFLLNRADVVLFLHNTLPDQPSQSPRRFHVLAAPPPRTRTLTKRRIRKSRRVKRKTLVNDGGEDNGFFVFGGGDFNSGDGYFGRGGGGNWWSFGGFGGANWEEFSNNSLSDPAFDFVFEILCWVAMLNWLHFALKKVVRSVADGFGDRAKFPMRLTPVC